MPGSHIAALLVAVGLGTVAPSVSADLYKWVDDKGIVNYSSTPPAARSAPEPGQPSY